MNRSSWKLASVGLLLVATAIPGCRRGPDGGGSLSHGAGVYLKHCALCHGDAGVPKTPLYPPLKDSEWLGGDPARLIAIVLDGANGPFDVGGRTYRGVMPAWRDVLKDEEIAAVLTFLRSQFANHASSVQPSQVADVRERTRDRRTFWTQEELRVMEGASTTE